MENWIKKLINTPLALFGLEVRRIERWTIPKMPVEANEFERSIITECRQFSMTGDIRMWALIQSMKYIMDNKIDGEFVECGVWKGGNIALMRRFADYHKLKTHVFGYDTFDGMPDATLEDVDLSGNLAIEVMKKSPKSENIPSIHAYAGIEQVKKNLEILNAVEGITLIKGKVEESLLVKDNLPKEISVLRLDTDWYESTKIELEVLFPRLVNGGVLIIDDYGHYKGAQKAVDEYFKNADIWLHYVDYTCRLMIKR